MQQAKIGGAAFNASDEMPTRGVRIRDYPLRDSTGNLVQFSDFRGRANLVILFAGSCEKILREHVLSVIPSAAELSTADAIALIVLVCRTDRLPKSANANIVFLGDESGTAHQAVGAVAHAGTDSVQSGSASYAPACYITDRFGEVFASFRSAEGTPTPEPREIIQWLEYVNSQCPECEPPEWPSET